MSGLLKRNIPNNLNTTHKIVKMPYINEISLFLEHLKHYTVTRNIRAFGASCHMTI